MVQVANAIGNVSLLVAAFDRHAAETKGRNSGTMTSDTGRPVNHWRGVPPSAQDLGIKGRVGKHVYICDAKDTLSKYYSDDSFKHTPKVSPDKVAERLWSCFDHTGRSFGVAKHFYNQAKGALSENATAKEIRQKAKENIDAKVEVELEKSTKIPKAEREHSTIERNGRYTQMLFTRLNPRYLLDQDKFHGLHRKPKHFGLFIPAQNPMTSGVNDGPVHGPSCANASESDEGVLIQIKHVAPDAQKNMTALLGAGRIFSCENPDSLLSRAVAQNDKINNLGTRSLVPELMRTALYEGPEATAEMLLALAYNEGYTPEQTSALEKLADPKTKFTNEELKGIYHTLPGLDAAFRGKIMAKIANADKNEAVRIINELSMAEQVSPTTDLIV